MITNDWISVNDELPGYLEDVITFDGEVEISHLEHNKERGNYFTDGFDILDVTHWMPKPPAPKEYQEYIKALNERYKKEREEREKEENNGFVS